MNIFMKQQTFSVDKFKKVETGWNIRVKNNGDNKTFFIAVRYYDGKLPPKFAFPWHTWKLTVVTVDDFIISAKLDNITLFELQPEEYPDNVKSCLLRGEKLMAEADAQRTATNNRIKELLVEYLKQIDINAHLEDDLSKLHICWRAPLKLWLFKGETTEDFNRRLTLTYKLVQIASRLYLRHTDTSQTLAVAWAALRYDVYASLWINQHLSLDTILEAVKDKYNRDEINDHYGLFFEIDELIKASLPPVKDELLQRYLNLVVRQIICTYAEDYATLDRNYATDAWYQRTCTDEEDYKRNYLKMKLPNYTSFILSPQISTETTKHFFQSYSLK